MEKGGGITEWRGHEQILEKFQGGFGVRRAAGSLLAVYHS